MPVTENIYNVD